MEAFTNLLPFSSFLGFLWGYVTYEPPLGLWDLLGLNFEILCLTMQPLFNNHARKKAKIER